MKAPYFMKCTGIVAFLLFISPAFASASPTDPATHAAARAVQLKERLEEIKRMDKAHLAPSEKKALRKEVRGIKKELAAVSGGIYLSIGAILLIALLLILLL